MILGEAQQLFLFLGNLVLGNDFSSRQSQGIILHTRDFFFNFEKLYYLFCRHLRQTIAKAEHNGLCHGLLELADANKDPGKCETKSPSFLLKLLDIFAQNSFCHEGGEKKGTYIFLCCVLYFQIAFDVNLYICLSHTSFI